QSNCRVPLLPLVPVTVSQLDQTLPLHCWLLPVQAAGSLPPLRHLRARSQFAPAAAMQLTWSALILMVPATEGSVTAWTAVVQALMPPAMIPQALAVAQAAAPDAEVTP